MGGTYLIYARAQGGDLVSGLCDGNTAWTPEAAEEVEAVTGPGHAPAMRPVAAPSAQALPGAVAARGEGIPWWPWVGGAGVVIALGRVWLGRHRRTGGE
ncbi:hypothetical protein [Intrasporangium sp.]|uniref:hypothetical protein n=1 Tax=Intrasporangium sp. TaxID=1925024 RepID=UPI003221DE28